MSKWCRLASAEAHCYCSKRLLQFKQMMQAILSSLLLLYEQTVQAGLSISVMLLHE
jgi:hypothetical protein